MLHTGTHLLSAMPSLCGMDKRCRHVVRPTVRAVPCGLHTG